MKSLIQLEKAVEKIEQQNKLEDQEIAWKNNGVRHFLLAIIIYFVAGLVLQVASYPQSWLKAFAPALGYLLMIFLLQFAKRFWERNIYKQ